MANVFGTMLRRLERTINTRQTYKFFIRDWTSLTDLQELRQRRLDHAVQPDARAAGNELRHGENESRSSHRIPTMKCWAPEAR